MKTEGRGSAKVAFDFAVSQWPMVTRVSATPWDCSKAEGIAVDVWMPEGVNAPDEVLKACVSVGEPTSPAVALTPGVWTTIQVRFADPGWVTEHGKRRALAAGDLGAVESVAVKLVDEPLARRDWWDMRLKGYVLVDNLRLF
jgi:hypothetical protein